MIKEIQNLTDFDIAKRLFREYVGELALDLSFQDFEEELENIYQALVFLNWS